MDCCVACQPIFTKTMSVYGYELLYRHNSGMHESGLEGIRTEGNAATSETVINIFQNIGFNNLTAGKRGFVNFTGDLLLAGVSTLLPRENLVIEVLEGILPTPEILDALREVKEAGYLIALDDFIVSPEFFPYLQYADIIKFDFLSTPLKKIAPLAEVLTKQGKVLLAEKIETAAVYDEALKMGFSLFQGYYFSRPTNISKKRLDPLRLNCVQLIRAALKPEIDFFELSEIIKGDVALTYSLLKLVNSAYFGLRQEVTGVRHALSLLGKNDIAKWVTLISMSRMKEDKPEELVRMSLLRGRLLESLSDCLRLDKNDLFFMGMFSLIDVLTDLPLKEVLVEIQLTEFVYANLTDPGKKWFSLIPMIAAYEKGNWDAAIGLAARYGISSERLIAAYVGARQEQSPI